MSTKPRYEPGPDVLAELGLDPADTPENHVNAAATLDLATVDFGNLSRTELAVVRAAARANPAVQAKADKMAREVPDSAQDRRRYRGNRGRRSPALNPTRASNVALADVDAALGAAMTGSGTLAELEQAEDRAIEALAVIELARLEDEEAALADKRARRADLLARRTEQATRRRAAQTAARDAQAEVDRLIAEHGITATRLTDVRPLSLRMQLADARHTARAKQAEADNLDENTGISALTTLPANVEDSKPILRRIAAMRASEMRAKK